MSSSSSSRENPKKVQEDLQKFFPGFEIQIYLDKATNTNNYIIRHESKDVMNEVSKQLADDHKVKGGSGNPKYVDLHGGNNCGIVLTDSDYQKINNYHALAMRVTDGTGGGFKISAEDILSKLDTPRSGPGRR